MQQKNSCPNRTRAGSDLTSGPSGGDAVHLTSIALFVFVLHHKNRRRSASWRLCCGAVNYIFKLKPSPDQLCEEWRGAQRRVWREGLIGVHKNPRRASSGLPSAEMWLGACAKRRSALSQLRRCRLRGPGCELIGATLRDISQPRIISCKNWERLHFLTCAYADICQCLLHIKWWETREKKVRVHKQAAFAKSVAKWIRKGKITREVRLLHWNSYCVFFSLAVGNKQSFFQGQNWSFSALTVATGFL